MKPHDFGTACLSALAVILFCSSCGKQGDSPASPPANQNTAKQTASHRKRGDDWLKLQDYKQAAEEFSQAVADEPASIEAHIGLVSSLVGIERFDNAVDEIDIVRKLDPQGNRPAELSRLVEGLIIKAAEQLINSSNDSSQMDLIGLAVYQAKVDTLFSNVELLRRVGSAQSVPFLKLLMGNPAATMAAKAESVLKDVSAPDVSTTLDALLASKDIAVKTRTAKRLWNELKSPKAGEVLLETIKQEVTTAGKSTNVGLSSEAKRTIETGLQNMDELGYGIAKGFYRAVITNAGAYHWELTLACINKVKAANDQEMKDAVVGMLRKGYLSDSKRIIGISPTQEALDYLAGIGDKTFLPELRAALGYNFMQHEGQCQPAITMLAKMDGKKWESFYWFYSKGGWTEFGKLNLDINKMRGDFGGSNKPVVDHSPEDAASVNNFFSRLGGSSPLGGGDKLKVAKVDVLDADRLKWSCYVTEGYSDNIVWEAEVVFRGTGLAENAWLITKVENFKERNRRIGGDEQTYLKSGCAKIVQKDYDGAIADLDKGLLWESRSEQLYYYRGLAKYRKRDYDGAIADEDIAVQLGESRIGRPSKDSLNIRGFAKCGKGAYDAAIADHEKSIQMNADNANAYTGLAEAKEKKGALEDAIADIRKAIDIDPNFKTVWLPAIERIKAKQKAAEQR